MKPTLKGLAGLSVAVALLSACALAEPKPVDPMSLLGRTVTEITEDSDLSLSMGVQDISGGIETAAAISSDEEMQVVVAACKANFEHEQVNVGVISSASATPVILQQARDGKFNHLVKDCK